MSVDGTQHQPLQFPAGGHLLQFLSCIESSLLPHGMLDPPLWSEKSRKLEDALNSKKDSPNSRKSSREAETDLDNDSIDGTSSRVKGCSDATDEVGATQDGSEPTGEPPEPSKETQSNYQTNTTSRFRFLPSSLSARMRKNTAAETPTTDAKPSKPPIKELQSPAAPSRISALERIDTVFRVVYQDGHRPEMPRNGNASRSTGGGTDSNPLNGNTVTGIGLFHGSQAHFFSPQNVFASWSLTEVSYRIGSVS